MCVLLHMLTPCFSGAFFLICLHIQKFVYICAMSETKMITRYEFAKKHKVAFQLIYARVKAGTIPVDENELIDSDFPFKRRLKSGRKPIKV